MYRTGDGHGDDPCYNGGGDVMCWPEAGPHSIGQPHDLSYLDPNIKDSLPHNIYSKFNTQYTQCKNTIH